MSDRWLDGSESDRLWWESSWEIEVARQRREAVALSRRTRLFYAEFEPRIFSAAEDQERSY